jgi:hypothetical protein
MGKSAYIIGNLISANTPLTSSTEDSLYTLANLYNLRPAIPFRFTVGTGGWIEIDTLGSKNYDTLALIGHNLLSTATVEVKVGASSPPTTTVGTPVWNDKRMWIDLGAQTARYVRVTITDANGVATKVGELILHNRTTTPRARRLGQTPAIARSQIAMMTQHLLPWVYTRGVINQWNFAFRVVGLTEEQQMRDLDAAVEGSEIPYLMIEDVDMEPDHSFFGRKEPGYAPVELSDLVGPAEEQVFDYLMLFTEDSLGRSITA